MDQIYTFAILGLGPAAIYALAGQGIVLIRQGTGVLNIAHGAFVLLGAASYETLVVEQGWPMVPAAVVAIGVAALGGAVVHLLVFWPLRAATELVRLIANIAVFVVLTQAIVLFKGSGLVRIESFYPSGGWALGDVLWQYDRVIMLAVAVVVTFTLWLLSERSTPGLAIRAASVNPTGAQALGYSPWRLGLTTWMAGAALAGLAGILILPISGFAPVTLTLVVLPAFAAALVGGLRSYMGCLIGALAIGIGQSLLVRFGDETVGRIPGLDGLGWSDALPFLVIIVVLFVRGSRYPTRDEVTERLPAAARSRASLISITGVGLVAVAFVVTGSRGMGISLATSALAFLMLTSLVVVIGLSGQVSLAQYTIAGVAALVAGRLSQLYGLPFPAALVLGIAAAVIVGTAFAIPALRTRGVTLAIVTLGLGAALQKVVFSNPRYTGGFGGTRTEPPALGGWEFGAGPHPERFAIVVIVIAALVSIAVANLRHGALGRRMLAVRGNELAAGAIGIDPARTKVLAFAIGSSVAGIAGVLMGFRLQSVEYAAFGYLESIVLVLFAVIGGVGYLTGALIGACLVSGGLLEYFLGEVSNSGRWIALGTGVALIGILRATPDGLAHFIWASMGKASPAICERPEPGVAVTTHRVETTELVVSGLQVRYGGVLAADGVSFTVRTGRLVGLIGANGAGKSSVLDAVTGLAPVSLGSIRLGGIELGGRSPSARARAGLARSFQQVELFADLSVAENLTIASEHARASRIFAELVHPAPPRMLADHEQLLAAFGLEAQADRRPSELPFGQRRLLGVAQAVATGAPIVLLDEPAAGLDDTEADELARTLRRLVDERGVGILLIEHRVDMVLRTSDEVVALDFGRVIFEGTPEQAREDPLLRAAYLGDEAVLEQIE